ncbi:MAG: nucleoside hydrolase [Myxococcota bacterium]
MTRPVVLDTDMGSDVDDALCLALALAAPEIEVVATTHVGREAALRAQISRKLLKLAGRDQIPVYAGCRVPVLGGDRFNWFGHEGDGILEPGEEPTVEDEHAVDALLRLSHAHPDLEVVAIGPLTNLAVALMKDPDLAGRVSRLTLMGGHLRKVEYGGHVFPPGVDYNLCSDPHASLLVLRSGIPTRLVTADVTLRVWLGQSDLSLIEERGTPLHDALASAIRTWTPVQNRLFSSAGAGMVEDNVAFLHDPLALTAVYDETFCKFEELEIEPAIEPEDLFRTLERPEPTDRSLPMRCAVDVEPARFKDHFMERVLGL